MHTEANDQVLAQVLELLKQSDRTLSSDPTAAMTLAHRARTLARDPSADLDARIACQIGTCEIWLGRYADAISALRHASERAQASGCSEVFGRAESNLGVAYTKLGDAAAALSHLDHALIIRRAANDRSGQAATLHNIGNQRRELGDIAGAREAYTEALGIDRDNGDRLGEGRTLNSIGVLAYEQKAFTEAEDLFRQAITVAEAIGDHVSALQGHVNLAAVAMDRARFEDALGEVDRGFAVAAHLDNRDLHADLHATRGKALRLAGRSQDALAALAAASALVNPESNKRLVIELNREMAFARESIGDAAGALDALKRAYDLEREVNTEDARRRLQAIAFRQEVERAHSRAARFEKLAHEDALTGLSNRRWLELKLAEFASLDLASPVVADTLPLSVVMLDIDHFKTINDRFSHGTGDEALRQLALLLREQCRDEDVVARYGGEEFSLLLPGVPLSAAIEVADRVRRRVEAFGWRAVHPQLGVTISAGVAGSDDAATIATLIGRADAALYRAKAAGRNCVCE